MSNTKERTWFRNTLFTITQPFIPPLGILPTVIHETIHWISALIIGIPASQITFGFHGINPGVTIPSTTPPESLPYFFYTPGLATGTILLALYIFFWMKLYYRRPSDIVWVMSMFTIFSVTLQIYMGILEGKYYGDYGAHIDFYKLLMFMAIGLVCHIGIFYFTKRFILKNVKWVLSIPTQAAQHHLRLIP